jgi:hypothetical protein
LLNICKYISIFLLDYNANKQRRELLSRSDDSEIQKQSRRMKEDEEEEEEKNKKDADNDLVPKN